MAGLSFYVPKGSSPTKSASTYTASGGGLTFYDPGKYKGTTVAHKSSGHGIGGFFHNLGSDIVGAVEGLPKGLYTLSAHAAKDTAGTILNPIAGTHIKTGNLARDAKAIAQSEAKLYSPLVHGHLTAFLNNVYQNPLQPILDAATVVTLGGSLEAKAADAVAMLKGPEAVLARKAAVAEARKLTIPGLAKAAYETGVPTGGRGVERIIVKEASKNPVIRARQRAINNLMNALPHDTPLIGSSIRHARVNRDLAGMEAAGMGKMSAEELAGIGQKFQRAYSKLPLHAQAAFHLLANGTLPHELAAHWEALKAEGVPIPDASLGVVHNADVAKLVKNYKVDHATGDLISGSKKIHDALVEGRKLSDSLTAERIRHGLLSPEAAGVRPYLMQRIINGAEMKSPGEAGDAVKTLVKAHEATLAHHAAQLDKNVPIAVDALRRATQGTTIQQLKKGLKGVETRLSRRAAGTTVEDVKNQLRQMQFARHKEAFNANVESGRAIKAANDMHLIQMEEAMHHGIIDKPGHSLAEIQDRIAARGHPQPFYMPMRSGVNSLAKTPRMGRMATNPTIAPKNYIHHIEGTLLNSGMLDLTHDVLSPSLGLAQRWSSKADLHDIMMRHSIAIPSNIPLPAGWAFLKKKTGEHIAHTDAVRAAFEHGAHPGKSEFEINKEFFATHNAADEAIATDAAGHRLIVPEAMAQHLMKDVGGTHSLLHMLYEKPTNVWKHLVLGLRPAFGVNLTIGNHVLGAMAAPSFIKFAASYIRNLSHSDALGTRITDETMQHVFPNQKYGALGHQEQLDTSVTAGANLARRAAHRAAQGIMPQTISIENFLRKALVDSWARENHYVKGILKENGGDINEALNRTLKERPHIIYDINKKTDAAIGNYRSYSRFEKGVKSAVPFYGWLRHITQATSRTIAERPGRAAAGSLIGTYGTKLNEQETGQLPDFMGGAIAIPGEPAFLGHTDSRRMPMLNTHQWNPYNSAVDVGKLALSLVHGKPGQMPTDILGNLNPLIQGLIEQQTGTSLLSGSKVKGHGLGALDIFPRVFGSTSEAKLIEALLGGTQDRPGSLYNNDLRNQAINYLGLPVKQTNLGRAHQMRAKQKNQHH